MKLTIELLYRDVTVDAYQFDTRHIRGDHKRIQLDIDPAVTDTILPQLKKEARKRHSKKRPATNTAKNNVTLHPNPKRA